MAGVGVVSGGGRALLVVGAAVLLASLLFTPLTWFTFSGASPDLPAGSYTSFQITQLLTSLVEGPWAPVGMLSFGMFGLLLASATAALAAAGMGRRTRNAGSLGIVISLLYAGLLYLTAYQQDLTLVGEGAAISIGYGFVAAVAGSALIEAGGRWPRAVPMRGPLPAVDYRK